MNGQLSKICVVVHYNGEAHQPLDTYIRKLNRYSFHLQYYGSRIGNYHRSKAIYTLNFAILFLFVCLRIARDII